MVDEGLETAEYRLLCRAIAEACRLEAAGDAAAGERCLLAGLERAQDMASSGEAWALALEREYRTALAEYRGLRPNIPPALYSASPANARARARR